ncbi:hypothetical protein VSS37_20420 [Candidatus Thiothrix sp. Deng01]|uniref:SH3 domain-containing protein n=1 Tax=Candidatus Thiothrix phosphatis TaxID=3112415 RepID=A0ABU6D2Q7_9GAMM|nr:hypothetical protein [Candidatus Thiothrix sp. Deng01]MEB4593354.1 hypothetical protein [Candidatus Thiothrix sp. Deng01]
MAQLVIKRASWWESNSAKQAMVWTPIATLQMGTLVGLGYFHHRLDDLETRTESLVSLDAAINQSARAVLRQEDRPAAALAVQERALPKPAPVSLQVMLNHPETLNTMSAGEDFSGSVLAMVGRAGYAPESAAPIGQVASGRTSVTLAAPPSGQPIKPVASKKTVPAAAVQHASAKREVGQPVAKTVRMPHLASSTREAAYAELEAARTAAANRMGLHVDEALLLPAQFPDKSLDAIAPPAPIVTEDASPLALPSMGGKPLPVGSVVWIYLGERRDYGWYGQRLHISPDSGLPEVGKSYHTQEVHGIYDRPHGDRAMGGFQQGDLVTILNVLHEANNGVWAKVQKAQSVGRTNH